MFDFPASPSSGQIFQPSGGPAWQWNGTAWAMAGAVQQATALSKNMVINGGVQFSQEWASNTSYAANGVYFADQWMANYSGPTGSTHLLYAAYLPNEVGGGGSGMLQMRGTATPYTTVGATNYVGILQYIEGNQIAQLGWGTAYAIPAVLSFEANCSVAGTYSVAFRSSNSDRTICFPIVISAGEVNTWKKFSFAVPKITDGTFPRDNTKGLELWFIAMAGINWLNAVPGYWTTSNSLAVVGQSNLLATANQSLFIRKVALYPDPGNTGVAPEYELPDYATELVKCQRYWEKSFPMNVFGPTYAGGGANGINWNLTPATVVRCTSFFRVSKRTQPACAVYSATDGAVNALASSAGGNIAATLINMGETAFSLNTAGATANQTYSYHWIATARM